MCACAHGNSSRPRIVAAVLEHVKLIVAAASTRGNTVCRFPDSFFVSVWRCLSGMADIITVL